jgi:hypothetical protein
MAGGSGKKRYDFRTVLLVSVVTLLVWLLAESRTVRTQVAEISPRIEAGTASEMMVRPAVGFPLPESVQVSLSGSTAGLDQVLRSLQGRLLLRLGLEIPATVGVHEIDLREVLRTSEILTDAGVGIIEVNPDRVHVEVDELAVASLPVRAIEPEGVLFENGGTPRTDPPALRVRGPASVLARLEGREGLVRLETETVETLRPGVSERIGRLRVELPEDQDRWGTVFDPEYVDVTLTLRSRTQSYTLAPMPVQVQLAPGEIGRWRVGLEPGQQDLVGIEVTGPSNQIDRLRSGEVVPTAVVALTFDELERGVESKRAQISGLPPGVSIVPGAELGVRLSIRRAEVPAGPEG